MNRDQVLLIGIFVVTSLSGIFILKSLEDIAEMILILADAHKEEE